jgi:hypothetical protein
VSATFSADPAFATTSRFRDDPRLRTSSFGAPAGPSHAHKALPSGGFVP